MKREERALLVLIAFVVGGFVGVLASGAIDWLGGQGWFSNGSNAIQWVSGPGTFAAVVGAVWVRWHDRCSAHRCIRHGKHPVKGTHKKVCHLHHTPEWHAHARMHHAQEHGWGDHP